MTQQRVVQTGLGFIEGPALAPDGGLCVASISEGCVHVLDADGRLTERIGTGGGPNGLAWWGDALFVAQNGGIFGASGPARPGVQMIRDGAVTHPFDHPFEAPNDLCFGPDGRLYVTDPRTDRALHEAIEGRVVACDPRTGRCDVVIEGGTFPNGLAFDAGGTHLFLARTYARLVERYALRDGTLHPMGVFCHIAQGRPDGMALDVDGSLWVCTPGSGGLEVFDPEGRPVRRLEFGAGSMPTNLCFGAPGSGTLFVTAAGLGSVLAVPVGVDGLALRRG